MTSKWWGLPLLLAAACVPGAKAPEPLNPVRFLLINDVYVADTLTDGSGGLARVATVRNRLADQGPLLFVLAGDVLSPSLLSKYYGGRQMVEALNAAKLDYATFGNHEFELARDTLIARIEASDFTWLSSNCTLSDGTRFPEVLPWDTVRMSGHLVGLFGLTLAGDYRSYVRCGDPDSAAVVAADSLEALGADLIVGLTHQTVEADRELLAREPRIEMILGGHEHEALDTVVSGRHVLKADANARTAQFATLWGGKGEWRQAVGLVPIDSRLPDDTTTARVVEAWADSLRRRLGPERAIGTTEAPIDARDAVSRSRESPIGALVTDAFRAGTGADVALLNAGAMRLDDVIPAGPVTNYQLESIFLFADETRIVTFPLTGSRLSEVLEHGVSDASLGKGGFLQVSGVEFTYDRARPSTDRLVGDLRRAGGETLEPGDTVEVAMAAYPACEGGDGYRIPEATESCADAASAPRAADLLMRYLADSLGGKISLPPGGRIVEAGPRRG
ncbi:MAG TPA: bifunctional metallophosphatase/5'-nucleotidase [Gemmatimonadales bacterium]|nr:bifunctional metallophosphatase/5'-nucleotidase [Gemmatimonadales bacterium]